MTISPKGWWYRASTEAKLRQVDAGIELGMTAPHIALTCGSNPHSLRSFAWCHGRHFPTSQAASGRKARNIRWAAHRLRKRYLAGEPVDFFDPGQRDVPSDDIAEVSFE